MTVSKNRNLVLIGASIRKLRKSRDHSQEAFAIKIGLDRSYYGGVERGERNISALNLIRIAKGLGVNIGELFPPINKLGD